MDRVRIITWIFFFLCIHLRGYYCLECYVCNTDPIFGAGDSDCVNITSEKYLENVTVFDPPVDAEVGIWTFCSLRVGQKDGRPTTYRTTQYVYKFHGESYCVEDEDWDGPYTTCYCRSDKCNGGSVDDFRNSGESTTGPPTTKIATTTVPSTTSSGGRKGLKCYSCNSNPMIGDPNPECHNITDDKYLQDFSASDPPDDQDFGFWTYCEIKTGQKDGSPWTYRSSMLLTNSHSDGHCEEGEDWDGRYTTCYCRSDKCNGGSVDDFGNSGESTTKLATTTAKLTTTPSEGDKGLKCYSCFSNPITELPDLGCNNITDDSYLEDYPAVDPPDDEEFGLWSYCMVTMGSKDGNPWSQRTKTFLYDSRSDGHCEEGENWMGKYKTCYCRSDKCNGGSVDEFENIGESTTGLPTTKMISTTIKQTTTSNGERKELTCYECDTHPVLPTFNPPQPECESNPKEEFIEGVPYYDFEGLKTYCSVQVTLEGGEKRTRRSFSLLNMDADGRCDFETNEQGQMTQKICYCRSDACNVQNVTLEHENGPSTTSASPSTGATSIISESTQAVVTTGSTRATTPTSKTTSKDDDSSGGENGSNNGYHSSGLLDYQVTMLMVHFTLVIVSASFAAYSVYVVAKHRRAIMESLSYSMTVQPCDKKVTAGAISKSYKSENYSTNFFFPSDFSQSGQDTSVNGSTSRSEISMNE